MMSSDRVTYIIIFGGTQIHYTILAESSRSWAESGGRPSTNYAEKDRQWIGLAGHEA